MSAWLRRSKRAIYRVRMSMAVGRRAWAPLGAVVPADRGRPSNSLNLDQAVAVITVARALPVRELRPSLRDVRRPAALMHACIVLSLLAGIRTEEARALRWDGETKTERSRHTLDR